MAIRIQAVKAAPVTFSRMFLHLSVNGKQYQVSAGFISLMKAVLRSPEFVGSLYHVERYYTGAKFERDQEHVSARMLVHAQTRKTASQIWAIMANMDIKASQDEHKFFDEVILPMLPKRGHSRTDIEQNGTDKVFAKKQVSRVLNYLESLG